MELIVFFHATGLRIAIKSAITLAKWNSLAHPGDVGVSARRQLRVAAAECWRKRAPAHDFASHARYFCMACVVIKLKSGRAVPTAFARRSFKLICHRIEIFTQFTFGSRREGGRAGVAGEGVRDWHMAENPVSRRLLLSELWKHDSSMWEPLLIWLEHSQFKVRLTRRRERLYIMRSGPDLFARVEL